MSTTSRITSWLLLFTELRTRRASTHSHSPPKLVGRTPPAPTPGIIEDINGSVDITITPLSDGSLQFEVVNETDMASFTKYLWHEDFLGIEELYVPAYPRVGGLWSPGAGIYQIYEWTE